MTIKIYTSRVIIYIAGGVSMNVSRGKVRQAKCNAAQSNVRKCVNTKPIVRINDLGIPVVYGGGKTMRELYLESK